MSGVLISRHVSKLRKIKGKTTPKGLEVTLLNTHVRPGIMPFLRQDWKMSGFTRVHRVQNAQRDRIHSRWNTTPVLPNKSCKQHLKRSNKWFPSNLAVSWKKTNKHKTLKNIFRTINITSAQQGKICNVWHLLKHEQACNEVGKICFLMKTRTSPLKLIKK